MRVLLTGASGYLGAVVAAELECRGLDVVLAGRGGEAVPLDLSRPETCGAAVAAVLPDRVLHCAAMAQAGDCARDPDLAAVCNGAAPKALAEAAPGRVVMVSTDLVFRGDRAPYRRNDTPEPLLDYGRSKVIGERAVRDAGGCVVRLPLLFGAGGAGRGGAVDVVRRALTGEIGLFEDEFRTPLHVGDAARSLVDVTVGCWQPGQVYHAAGPERVSRWQFAQRYCAVRGEDPSALRAAVCGDPLRPGDVSLVGDFGAGRTLDAMLADS